MRPACLQWLVAITLFSCLSQFCVAADPYNDATNGSFDGITQVPLQVRDARKNAEAGSEKNADKGSDFVVVPIPRSDPTLDTGLTLVAAYFNQIDPDSSPSVVGIGALATSNGSWGLGVGQSARFRQDRLRLDLALAYVDLHYDFFGIGSSSGKNDAAIPLRQKGYLVSAQGSAEVGEKIFLGVKGRYLTSQVSTENGLNVGGVQIPLPDLSVDSGVVGPTLEWDTRNDRFAPKSGYNFYAEYLFGAGGQTRFADFAKLNISFSSFHKVFSDGVLAFRASACRLSGRGPFFEYCMLGSADKFRGYEVGRFRDRALVTGQGEYRGRFNETWGYVVFGGIASVASSFGDLPEESILPAGGAGLRFRVSRDFGVDLSLDVSVAPDSRALYLYVGQKF